MKNSSHGITLAKKFKLKYHSSTDDSCPDYYFSEKQPEIGEVIFLENMMYHCVYNIAILKQGVRLDLGGSATSIDEARLLAEQDGLYPKISKPRGRRRAT